MTRSKGAVAVALLLLGSAQVAQASPLFELTGGFGGMGGLQARHTGPSAASAYFNPALLTGATTGLTVGVLVLNTNIGVHVDARSPENMVPDGTNDAFHANGTPILSKPAPTELLQNGKPASGGNAATNPRPRQHQGSGDQTLTYGAIGLVTKLMKDRLGVGVYGLVPIKNFVTLDSFYVDEHEQYSSNSLHPELYSDRLSALSFAGGAGVRLTKTLSLGVGATINLVANAQAPVYVANASELTKLDLNVHAKAKVRLTPHAGLAWNPGKRWHFTGTLHAPQKFDLHASFTFLLGGNDQSSGLALAYWYKPWQASVGAGYDFYVRGEQVWGASYTLQYERWSRYIDRQSVRPAGAYAWSDTINGTMGLRGQSGPLSLGLDGRYTPSPVPSQTGRTNYVDNDRVGSSLNMEYAFKVFDFDFKLGAQLQLYRLITRSVKKITPPPSPDGVNRTPQLVWDEVPDDSVRSGKPLAGREGLQTNNPGWPGYSSRGWVSSGGIYLSLYM